MIALLICGLAVGWLVGQSASETLAGVLTTILAIISGYLAIAPLAKDREPSDTASSLPPVPNGAPVGVAVLLVGIVVGSAVGLYMRTNQVFGPNIDRISRLTDEPRENVARALFLDRDETGTLRVRSQDEDSPSTPGLFSASLTPTACEEIAADLRAGRTGIAQTKLFEEIVANQSALSEEIERRHMVRLTAEELNILDDLPSGTVKLLLLGFCGDGFDD